MKWPGGGDIDLDITCVRESPFNVIIDFLTISNFTPKTFLVPLLGLGGIHAIGALVAIKFKLVLIFLAVMGTVFYGYKIYAGSSCPGPIISSEHSGILPFEG